MESKNKFIKATSKDNYSSILIKIIKQDNNHTKLIVYHMFEYIKNYYPNNVIAFKTNKPPIIKSKKNWFF